MSTIARAEGQLTRSGGRVVARDKTSQTWTVNGQSIDLILTDSYGQTGPNITPTVVNGVMLNGYPFRNLTAAIKVAKETVNGNTPR